MNLLSLLLNWRVWIAVSMAVLAAAGGWKCYVLGQKSVQVEFDAYKNQQVLDRLAAEQAAREKEHSMLTANQKVSQNYESLKVATATAVSALDADRLQLQSSIAAARGASCDPKAGPATDATPEDIVLGQCLQRYEAVAGDAKVLADQVIGLQEYVTKVVKP